MSDLASTECVLEREGPPRDKCIWSWDGLDAPDPLAPLEALGLMAGALIMASASAESRCLMARNFLWGLYASSINELVSYRGGACNTRFNTGMSSTGRRSSTRSSRDERGLELPDDVPGRFSCFSLPDSIPESVGESNFL